MLNTIFFIVFVTVIILGLIGVIGLHLYQKAKFEETMQGLEKRYGHPINYKYKKPREK